MISKIFDCLIDGDLADHVYTVAPGDICGSLRVLPSQVADTLALAFGEECIVLVKASTAVIDDKKFKETFGFYPVELQGAEVKYFTDYDKDELCPFGLPKETVRVYIDESLREHHKFYHLLGPEDKVVELTWELLFLAVDAEGAVDVTRPIYN